jgi:hypothetical protein
LLAQGDQVDSILGLVKDTETSGVERKTPRRQPMASMTRRKAMKLAAAAGATALGASTVGAAEEPRADRVKAEGRGAAQLFAVVDQDGDLKRGLHAKKAVRVDVGTYEVLFSRNVRQGAFLVTIGGHGWDNKPLSAIATVLSHPESTHTVVVFTQDLGGIRINSGFHLLVVCPEEGN